MATSQTAAGSNTGPSRIRPSTASRLILSGLVATLLLALAGTSTALAQVRIVTIQQVSTGRYVDAYEDTYDTVMVTRDAQGDDTQKWRLTPLGNNVYTIQQVSTGRYVDAYDYERFPNEIGGGYTMTTRPAQDNDTQKWLFTEVAPDVFTIQQVSTGRYAVGLPDPDHDYIMFTSLDDYQTHAQWRVTTLNLVANPNNLPQVGPGAIQVAPPAATEPVVHIQGSTSILAASTFDLDTGASNGPGSDIRFQLIGRQIVPINGAMLRVNDIAGGPNIGHCLNLSYSSDPVTVDNLPPGGSVCYRTNEGRIGELVVEGVGVSLNISYTTWEP
jgi:hypothetical protein